MVIPLCHLTFNFTYNSLGGPELPLEKMKLFELPGVTQFKIRPALIGLQQISHYKALFDPGRKNVIHELMDITRGMGSKTCQSMISILKYSPLWTKWKLGKAPNIFFSIFSHELMSGGNWRLLFLFSGPALNIASKLL